MIALRKQLSLKQQQKASHVICERIRSLPDYHKAQRIALYRAVKGEVNLDELWIISNTQRFYFPVIQLDKTLQFLPATPHTTFITNTFGILEPDVDMTLAIAPQSLDILLLPLVAFDEYGTRIGMGGGFYDRTLANERPPLLIGVGYEFQRQSFIEPAAWDISLTAVVTEARIDWSK